MMSNNWQTIVTDVRNQVKRHTSKRYGTRTLNRIAYIVRHHSATATGDVFSFARYHVDHHKWPGPAYHFVIKRNGQIQWANDLTTITYGVGGHNTPCVHICLVGNGSFTEAQERSYTRLVNALMAFLEVEVSANRGHNEFDRHRSNACPGINMTTVRRRLGSSDNLGSDEFGLRVLRKGDRGAAVIILQKRLIANGEKLPRFGPDGDFGNETKDAVMAFQSRHGLNVDGIVGPKTYAVLDRIEKEKQEKKEEVKKIMSDVFKDLSESHTLFDEVKKGKELGIVNGYPDGTFKPNEPLTRAQGAAMNVRVFEEVMKRLK